jgi:hypothetical protein
MRRKTRVFCAVMGVSGLVTKPGDFPEMDAGFPREISLGGSGNAVMKDLLNEIGTSDNILEEVYE